MNCGFCRDFSFSALVAGFVTVLVGFTSTGVVVFRAAEALGGDAAQIASWIWALGIGMGLSSIGLSLRYRQPLITAWSTPGAALLVTSVGGATMGQGVGAFLFCGALIFIAGATGLFERVMQRIPLQLAAAMFAGLLLRFAMEAFTAMASSMALVLPMFAAYLALRRWYPRYAVAGVLLVGVAIAWRQGGLDFTAVHPAMTYPVWTTPVWSPRSLLGIGLPLFIVTMSSQNVPGVATLKACGYPNPPVSAAIATTGAATVLLAPFGAYALNLAAITAAICAGPEAHHEPSRRYVAAVCAGVFYIAVGLLGATVVAFFGAFPKALVAALAGFALLNTIGNGLATAMTEVLGREAALVTFVVTASGVVLFGIGSAFWGLVAGSLTLLALRGARL